MFDIAKKALKFDRNERISELSVAFLRGFEPPAYRLGGGCSIQLSYRNRSVVVSRHTG